MSSWRTTTLGILTILSTSCNIGMGMINGTPVDWPSAIAAITAGIGLITARDHKVSDVTAKASP